MKIPDHLKFFLDGTPLAIERLKLAWTGLSEIDRIYILSSLFSDISKEFKAVSWSHLRKQIIDLALADNNGYIRYLAAREVGPFSQLENQPKTPRDLEGQAQFEKVRADLLPLVRSAYQEKGGKPTPSELDDVTSFWNRNQIERLVLVSGLPGGGEKIAKLLRYATKKLLPSGVVKIEEMVDVLLQYISWKPMLERLADSEEYAIRNNDQSASILARGSVQALWEVIPDLPKNLSSLLIECLPLTEGVSSILSPTLFDTFDEHQLTQLLRRNDIPLKEYRRTLYKNSTNEQLRQAAVSSSQFELRDSDISALVYEPMEQVESGKKKVKELALLAISCKGATQIQMEAIYDLIKDAPNDFYPGLERWDEIGLRQVLETQKAKNPSFLRQEDEFLSLYLYRLARHLSSMRQDDYRPQPSIESPDKQVPPQTFIVSHSPWQTYLNLKSLVRLNRYFAAFPKWFVELSHPEQALFALATLLGIFLLYR